MSRRLVSSAVLATWIVLLPALAASQPETSHRNPGLTAWGEPDLQGLWTNATITPLQRPEQFAGRQFLTDEEIAQLEERALRDQFAESAPRAGDPGTYNQVWFDRGTQVVSTRRTSLIVDPPDGRIPWKPEARKRYERSRARYGVGPYESWLDMDTGERCLTDGLPMVPTQGYNMNYRILQAPGYVVILHEMFHEFRIIPLDGRPHLPKQVGQWLGDSRGRWEGNTLVVETTNFADKSHYWWAEAWRASRPNLRLVERLTRVDDDTIDYQFTMHDTESFERPWTAVIPMTTNQAERGVTVGEMFEYACHEGNYSVSNMLRGARSAEEEATARPK